MLKSFLFRPLGWGILGLWLCQCSLSLEDPEDEARAKLAKTVPVSFAALEGRWAADSTYTAEAVSAHVFPGNDIRLEIYADTSLHAVDASRLVFARGLAGRYRLRGDTLFHQSADSAIRDTFTVKLRFLGNWLEMIRHSDRRHVHFHKLKPPNSAYLADSLDNSLWLLQGRSNGPGSVRYEPLRRDFSYVRFSENALSWEWNRNGVRGTDSGPLAKDGRNWVWAAGGGNRGFIADMVDKDSLRLWPLHEARPDSGYLVFRRAKARHPFDFDMRPWLGYMRSDSIVIGGKALVNHYGRFYDLEFAPDHSVRTETNMDAMPNLLAWSLDSGYVRVDAAAEKGIRLRADTLPGGRVRLTADSGKAFAGKTVLNQTKVDPSRFQEHPMERFDRAGYAHIAIAGDTLRYYFNPGYAKRTLDEFEIAGIKASDTAWLILASDRARETFLSSQSGFRFAFEGRTAALGRFVCEAVPGLDLAVRLTAAADPDMAQGLLQGSCRVVSAEAAPPDSVVELVGSFRFRRHPGGAPVSPLWSRP